MSKLLFCFKCKKKQPVEIHSHQDSVKPEDLDYVPWMNDQPQHWTSSSYHCSVCKEYLSACQPKERESDEKTN